MPGHHVATATQIFEHRADALDELGVFLVDNEALLAQRAYQPLLEPFCETLGVENVASAAGRLRDDVFRPELLDANDARVCLPVRFHKELCFQRLLHFFRLGFLAGSVLSVHRNNLLAVAAPEDCDQGYRCEATAEEYDIDPAKEQAADGHDIHEDDPRVVRVSAGFRWSIKLNHRAPNGE